MEAGFARQVRDALRHLYDPVYLQTHPLTSFLPPRTGNRANQMGLALRRCLLDAITALGPERAMQASAGVGRRHQLMVWRYAEGLDIAEVLSRLAISHREYHREHRAALHALVSLMWERLRDGAPNGQVSPTLLGGSPTLAGGTIAPRERLPRPSDSFIGRERELSWVKRLLGSARLLTITGAPGAGKTRLAIEAGTALRREFGGEVYFVPLAAIREPELVIPAIARALDVRDDGRIPLKERLAAHVRNRRLLLILDNFEQVAGAAPLVAELLVASPLLRALVTSRQSLHVSGEHEFMLPPLALPDPDHALSPGGAANDEAIVLFVERARVAKAGFTLTEENVITVAEICRRLDGLPLAIELAAAHIRRLSPGALLERLDHRLPLLTRGGRDLPARRQTLRGALDWSHDLLDVADRRLFRRLAVFVDGCTLEEAEQVCLLEGDQPWDLLEQFASLVDKSLLQHHEVADGESRFSMFETISEYARERLHVADEAEAIRRRHARTYVRLAEEAEQALNGPRQIWSLDWLEREHGNLRAALAWSIEHDSEAALRLAGALSWFWDVRNYREEGLRWLDRALQAAPVGVAGRAKALYGRGSLLLTLGEPDRARPSLEESLALYEERPDQRGAARALNQLGFLARTQGDYEQAHCDYDRSLELCRASGDHGGAGRVLTQLGRLAQLQGDWTLSRSLLEEAVPLHRQAGDRLRLGQTLRQLGILSHHQGDDDRARALMEESVQAFRQVGHHELLAWALLDTAEQHQIRGNHDLAGVQLAESLSLFSRVGGPEGTEGIACVRRCLGKLAMATDDLCSAKVQLAESLASYRDLGHNKAIAWLLHDLGDLAARQNDYEAARRRYVEGLILAREAGDGLGVAQALDNLGFLSVHEGNCDRGVRLMAAAAAEHTRRGRVADLDERVEHDACLDLAQTALGEPCFTTAWTEGEATPLEQAASYALDEARSPTYWPA